MPTSPALEVVNITKRFPGVVANNHINFTLKQGEIHCLLGENGAGKSTLMNIIYGLYPPDEGELRVNGQQAVVHSPNDAIALGIGMVHQHFMLVDVLTVTENIMLGNEVRSGLFLNRKQAAAEIRELSQKFGLAVDPDAVIEDLPVGYRQRAEILKALYRNAKILILDEPTAVLTPQEAQDLFKVMRALVDKGVSIIFITHKLKEVLQVADTITVLRRGEVVGSTTPAESTEGSLAAMMVGREVILTVDKSPAKPQETILQVNDLQVLDDRLHMAVAGVDLDVHAGEILGIAGVEGNGQTELVEALTGLRPPQSGTVTLLGQPIQGATPRTITEMGVGHVPADREKDGFVRAYPIADNLILNTYYRAPFANRGLLNDDAALDNARHLIEQFDIRTPGPLVSMGNLSGGNKQKAIVAREFSRDVHLLIASQPTRGLDVGSIEFIHKQIIKKRDAGVAVLLVSAELDEILSLSDRIAVMYRGKVVATLPATEATRENLGLLMAGITPTPAEAPAHD